MLTVIDSDDYAASGIETMFFPGGEPHVKVPKFEGDVLFFGKLRTWNDVGFAALVVNAVSQQEVSFFPFIPYFPGARQDKYDERSALTLYVIANMFDTTNDCYHVFDPHSVVLDRYLNIFTKLMPSDLALPPEMLRRPIYGVIAPDEGAVDRAEDFRRHFYPNAQLIKATKERDSRTGKLSNYRLPPLPGVGGYIVVDDICDGGGTFNLLAQAFQLDPNSRGYTLELFVSHGIFSKGLDAIDPLYNRITTTNSWCRLPTGGRLTVLDLASLFPLITGKENV